MENNKLKKLGKYFTKGLQAGVLATALITGLTGCPSPTGNTTIEDDWHDTGDDPNKGDITTEFPNYYDMDSTVGQSFVYVNHLGETGWYSSQTCDKTFDDAFAYAKKYIAKKAGELSIAAQNKDQDLYNMANALKINNAENTNLSIGQTVESNSRILAKYFAKIETPLLGNSVTDEEYHTYKYSYAWLAHEAYYTKNLDGYPADNVPSQTDMYEESLFMADMFIYTDIKYDDLKNNAATIMNESLSNVVSRETPTDVDLLKKAVELALCNESLYGLHDLANICEVKKAMENNLPVRNTRYFEQNIRQEREQAKTIDDRTL